MEPYIGQITLFAGDVPPKGWTRCDGSDTAPWMGKVLSDVINHKFDTPGTPGHGYGSSKLPNLKDLAPPGMMYIICHEGANPLT
jgi:microcystin-dependent protein